jgi:hypothetical protein
MTPVEHSADCNIILNIIASENHDGGSSTIGITQKVVPSAISDFETHIPPVVSLAQWQLSDLPTVALPRPIVMSEFNTAACGGIPGISDTYTSALWVVDYTLQLASVGYEAAYIHTREESSVYSMFYSEEVETSSTTGRRYVASREYITRPGYYALPIIKEALTPFYRREEVGDGWGVAVKDLNLHSRNRTAAGYALYDRDPWSSQESRNASTGADRLVLFNYRSRRERDEEIEDGSFDDGTSIYQLPRSALRPTSSSIFETTNSTKSSDGEVPRRYISILHIRYLTALNSSPHERTNISWSGLTLSGVPDGRLRRFSHAGLGDRARNRTVLCEDDGMCNVELPPMSLALVWMEEVSVQEGAAIPDLEMMEGDADDGWWDADSGKFITNAAIRLRSDAWPSLIALPMLLSALFS